MRKEKLWFSYNLSVCSVVWRGRIFLGLVPACCLGQILPYGASFARCFFFCWEITSNESRSALILGSWYVASKWEHREKLQRRRRRVSDDTRRLRFSIDDGFRRMETWGDILYLARTAENLQPLFRCSCFSHSLRACLIDTHKHTPTRKGAHITAIARDTFTKNSRISVSPPDVFRTIKPEKSVKTSFFHDNTPSHRKYCWEIPPRSESHSLHSPQRRRRRRESPVSLSLTHWRCSLLQRGTSLGLVFFSSFSSVSHSH